MTATETSLERRGDRKYPRHVPADSVASVFRDRVVAVIEGLAAGEVVSYGDVAAQAGFPGAARGVGAVLASADSDGLPWWRVVTSAGRLVPGHETEHARRLRAEGVEVVNGRVRRHRSNTQR